MSEPKDNGEERVAPDPSTPLLNRLNAARTAKEQQQTRQKEEPPTIGELKEAGVISVPQRSGSLLDRLTEKRNQKASDHGRREQSAGILVKEKVSS